MILRTFLFIILLPLALIPVTGFSGEEDVHVPKQSEPSQILNEYYQEFSQPADIPDYLCDIKSKNINDPLRDYYAELLD
jgi:hypothetical protein